MENNQLCILINSGQTIVSKLRIILDQAQIHFFSICIRVVIENVAHSGTTDVNITNTAATSTGII